MDASAQASKSYGATGDPVLYVHGNSALLTAGIIVADVVGAGILSMPLAVGQLGYALSVIVIILMLAMNLHISMLLWRAFIRHPEARTLSGLVRAVMEGSSPSLRYAMTSAVDIGQSVCIFAELGLYALTFGKALGMLLYETFLCLPVWTFLASSVVLIFQSNARSLGTYSSLIWLNCATIVGTVMIPLIYMAAQGVETSRPLGSKFLAIAEHIDVSVLSSSMSIFAFAFSGQLILVEIMSEMEHPADFPKAYSFISIPFQALAFLAAGIGGYYYRGSLVAGMIGDNIPFGLSYRAAAFCLLTHMLITYMIKAIVFCRRCHSVLHPEDAKSYSSKAWATWFLVTLMVLASSWLTAQVVPFFSDMVSLLGACLTPALCWVLPVFLFYSSHRRDGGQIGPVEQFIIVLELLFCVALTFIGTYDCILKMLSHWHTYGGPFQCHCEDVWNSCSCSANHPGMELCFRAS